MTYDTRRSDSYPSYWPVRLYCHAMNVELWLGTGPQHGWIFDALKNRFVSFQYA